jgi:hypothetical protein
VSWRQKSRALQLKEGDNNKKFFHRLANLNKRNNSIESLMVDGNMTKESAIIQDHIVNFYLKKKCIVNDINGDQRWMIILLVPLMMRREFEEFQCRQGIWTLWIYYGIFPKVLGGG